MSVEAKKIDTTNNYVYDISLDGTVVNALGCNILSNTDGFNFALPKEFKYTKENPYIGQGLSRNTVKGKEYYGLEGDVAEFEDLYMRGKMGLGIDEIVPSSINFSRKNYCDLLDDGSVKLVGNTVKSRRMSGFIAKFLEQSIPMLLEGRGQDFINYYNDYISKIYNYQIPLRDIASKGKIKKTLAEYKKDCKTVTKSGSKKSRQVWYELALINRLNVNLDDTLYYINCGTKKSESDVKRITHQFVMWEGEKTKLTTKIKKALLEEVCEKKNLILKGLKNKEKKELLKPFIIAEEDEIIVNCTLVPQEIIDAEEDVLCNGEIEYNVVKYIDQFNSRITPLLVCFHPNIRSRILITNPDDKQYFTAEECELVSGYPNKELDQDTFEQLMTPERKEIEYWVSVNKIPPFVKECDIDWDKLVAELNEVKIKEKDELFQILDKKYLETINSFSPEEKNKWDENCEIPSKITDFMVLNTSNMCLYFKDIPDMTPSTGGYIFEDFSTQEDNSDKEIED